MRMSEAQCSRCRLPLHQNEAWEYRGSSISHKPNRCVYLITAERDAALARAEAAEAENARLTEALRFYADRNRYPTNIRGLLDGGTPDMPYYMPGTDQGDIARSALTKDTKEPQT